MALINCPECKTAVSDQARSCPSCGYPIAEKDNNATNSANAPQVVSMAKSRGTYIILGLIFGSMGFHDFYAGYNGQGTVKLILFILAFLLDATTGFYSKFFLIVGTITWIWALISLCVVKADASGKAFG
ncbi:NINE protein [Burkholderia pseudomallei]|uniref:NINE protein n=1 Tax=Burkholderia pseudomallei TaxID=28450 RepID=UPI00050D9955|nr:TM2 domain-containing protein [Burkholderia pseudomallei]KGC45678.1 TM2 domain protein [Burkholderia pseudomallei]